MDRERDRQTERIRHLRLFENIRIFVNLPKIPILSKKKKKKTTGSKNTREGTWNGLSWKEKNKEQRENV